MPRVLLLDRAAPDPAILAEAAAVLARGGLVAFPTETVYGLGARGLHADEVAKIFVAKGRPTGHPVILHVDGIAMARSLAARRAAVVAAAPGESARRAASATSPGRERATVATTSRFLQRPEVRHANAAAITSPSVSAIDGVPAKRSQIALAPSVTSASTSSWQRRGPETRGSSIAPRATTTRRCDLESHEPASCRCAT